MRIPIWTARVPVVLAPRASRSRTRAPGIQKSPAHDRSLPLTVPQPGAWSLNQLSASGIGNEDGRSGRTPEAKGLWSDRCGSAHRRSRRPLADVVAPGRSGRKRHTAASPDCRSPHAIRSRTGRVALDRRRHCDQWLPGQPGRWRRRRSTRPRSAGTGRASICVMPGGTRARRRFGAAGPRVPATGQPGFPARDRTGAGPPAVDAVGQARHPAVPGASPP